MQKVKKGLRLIGVILLIILASIGMGISGVVLPSSRERYMDVEIKIEQVDKKEDEELEKDEVKT
jgi:hypothetical protein